MARLYQYVGQSDIRADLPADWNFAGEAGS
jgi:hypothetical protein